MTINDLPKRLQVDGVQIYEPGKQIIVNLSEERMQLHEKNLRRMVDEKFKQEKAGA